MIVEVSRLRCNITRSLTETPNYFGQRPKDIVSKSGDFDNPFHYKRKDAEKRKSINLPISTLIRLTH